ncbi:MAG: hypothetical protein CL670_03775 [Balneola sp.]|jgi:hypothetical protein|nr:hypothetical protein [Balneola sp.]MBE78248.1 hypothetical protein [Balneola sp.]|tara:strand:+ start:243 stop:830 length:588 start_codon:yes stop_codon:yes gene_type:complete
MRFQNILLFIVAGTLITACSSSKQTSNKTTSEQQANCSLSDYAEYYNKISQNAVCGEKYEEGSNLYGLGDMNGPERQSERLERIAQSNARMELGQKAAAFQNKIKGSITEVQNADGTTSSIFSMEIDVQLNKVSEVASACEEGSRGFACYSLMEMPKSVLLESTATALQEENEELYQKWMASEQYQSLLAESTGK